MGLTATGELGSVCGHVGKGFFLCRGVVGRALYGVEGSRGPIRFEQHPHPASFHCCDALAGDSRRKVEWQ